jgi:hypothetical protein
MKSKLGFNFFLTLGIFYIGIPLFAKIPPCYKVLKGFNDSTYFLSNPIVKIGDGCSGYLFPGTNIIWTLNKCLNFNSFNKEAKLVSLITSSPFKQPIQILNAGETVFRDTFKNPQILYQYNNWALLEVDIPNGYYQEGQLFKNILSSFADTLTIGYPSVTNFESDAVKNYVDLILLPQWKYQEDNFLISINQQDKIYATESRNQSVSRLEEIKKNNKEYLINIRKSEASYIKAYTTNKAIDICLKKWTDHYYVRNRIATLSSFEESPSKLSKLKELLQAENKVVETQGLATNLYLTFSLLPIDLLPTIALDIILTFQKDYFKAAQFLIEQPNILNQINLAIRNIRYLPINSPKARPNWNQRDTIINGTGSLQLIQKIIDDNLQNKGYWIVPGMDGAPVFSDGKLLGIQEEIPFYFAREFKFEKKLKFISVTELMNVIDEEKDIEIFKKISGLIKK